MNKGGGVDEEEEEEEEEDEEEEEEKGIKEREGNVKAVGRAVVPRLRDREREPNMMISSESIDDGQPTNVLAVRYNLSHYLV